MQNGGAMNGYRRGKGRGGPRMRRRRTLRSTTTAGRITIKKHNDARKEDSKKHNDVKKEDSKKHNDVKKEDIKKHNDVKKEDSKKHNGVQKEDTKKPNAATPTPTNNKRNRKNGSVPTKTPSSSPKKNAHAPPLTAPPKINAIPTPTNAVHAVTHYNAPPALHTTPPVNAETPLVMQKNEARRHVGGNSKP
ncbi:hypothetical protein BC829DRAFT_378607 [Chytridium lagenaria]|nr:hypothetical protein BC829DRAFT_378607 [Chytridium lagenaria]